VDETGSGSCPVAGFGISGVEPSGSATKELSVRECVVRMEDGWNRLRIVSSCGLWY
jgi:hypothetical protein